MDLFVYVCMFFVCICVYSCSLPFTVKFLLSGTKNHGIGQRYDAAALILSTRCIIQKQPFRGVFRKRFLKICRKFTGKHPCRSAISIKLQYNIRITFILRKSCSAQQS